VYQDTDGRTCTDLQLVHIFRRYGRDMSVSNTGHFDLNTNCNYFFLVSFHK